MILEGIVTTRNADASTNVAPMGPVFALDADGRPKFDSFRLRPFKTSLTFQNLRREQAGVFHVIDDVLLLVRAALLECDPPPLLPAANVSCLRLHDCCRYFEFAVDEIDETNDRSEMTARVVSTESLRGSCGWNRAQFAVLEATIQLTRRHLIPPNEIADSLKRLRPLVEKTGGPKEKEAFGLLEQIFRSTVPEPRG